MRLYPKMRLNSALPCRAALVAILGLLTGVLPATAADSSRLARHALVVGNSSYPVSELGNPGNDARAIAERLRQAGFNVTLKLDTRRHELQQAIRQFTTHLANDPGVGLFYYAGHGLQLNWRNFLVPIDARVRSKADVQSQTVDLGQLLDGMAQARNTMNIVILDACRDNPFGTDFRVDDPGLSQIDAPSGTLLAFATAPGNVASDGSGEHGLYTDQLLKEMLLPGAAVEEVFKRVRLSVRRSSQGAQLPWESTSLERDFSFVPGSRPGDASREFEHDLARWQELRASADSAALEAFIRERPNGKFSELAQFRLDQLLAAGGEKLVKTRQSKADICLPGMAAPYVGNPLPFKVGERYEYRRLNLVSGQEIDRPRNSVQRIEGDEVFFEDGKTVTDRFGNSVRAPDGRQWTPYQFFIHDYQVGKRWSAQFLVTLADGRQVNQRFDLRVAGRERITLPAGSFDAFRIEARGANLSNGAQLERTAWVAPDKMRGFLAQESLVRQNGEIVEGERSELINYRPPAPASSGGFSFGY